MNTCNEVTLKLRLAVLKEKYRMLAVSHERLEVTLKGVSVSTSPEALERGSQIAEQESEVRFALENTSPSLHV